MEKEVFAELYESNIEKVFRYVYYRTRNRSVAEDITSSAFEKALEKLNTFKAKKASFSTWLIVIARNTMIDYFRKSKPEITVERELTGPSSEEKVVNKEERQRLLHYIDKLNSTEQEIISLKFGSSLTNRQIAKILNLSESNVSTIIYRSVNKLRNMFMEEEE